MGPALAVPLIIGGTLAAGAAIHNAIQGHEQRQYVERQTRQMRQEAQRAEEDLRQQQEETRRLQEQLRQEQAAAERRRQEIAATRASNLAEGQRQEQQERELAQQQRELEQQEAVLREVVQQLNDRQDRLAARELVLRETMTEVQQKEQRIREDRDRFFPEPDWLRGVPEPRFAVTGEAGAGKSSFMNRLRGLDDTDHQAAEVGALGDTTLHAQRYEIRDGAFARVSIFDLPGMGTVRQPEVTYVSSQGLFHYNGIVIFHKDRAKTSDIGLFRFARRNGIKWYIVRNQIDITMSNDHRQTGRTPEQTLEHVKMSPRGILEEYLHGIREDPRMDSNPMGYDEEELRQQLLDRIFCLSSLPDDLVPESMKPAVHSEWQRLQIRVAQDVEEFYTIPRAT